MPSKQKLCRFEQFFKLLVKLWRRHPFKSHLESKQVPFLQNGFSSSLSKLERLSLSSFLGLVYYLRLWLGKHLQNGAL
jgi:hypothetical protein